MIAGLANRWRCRRARTVGWSLLPWIVAVLGTGCDRLPGKPTPAEVPLEPRNVTNFVQLYGDNCAGCHGVDGRGNGALALANPVYLAVVDDATLRRVIAQGIPGSLMPAFARSAGGFLTDAQVEILVQEMRSRWARPIDMKGATLPPYADDGRGYVELGAKVFANFCAHCHRASGRGAGTVGSIVDGSYLALVSNQSLRTTVIAGRPDRGHPDWRQCVPGKFLSGDQVSDVVAWLVSQRVAVPGQPYPQTP